MKSWKKQKANKSEVDSAKRLGDAGIGTPWVIEPRSVVGVVYRETVSRYTLSPS